MIHFACRKFDHLAIEGKEEGEKVHLPRTRFSHAHIVSVLVPAVVTVVLQVTVISSRIDFTHTRGSCTT